MHRSPGAIGRAFAAAAAEDRAALVLYTTAGHPSPGEGPATLIAIADAGADVIELGVPFSDPLADGPTIQRASFAAIERGVDLRWTLDAVAGFRMQRDTPIVLMTYLNPVLDFGVGAFIEAAVEAGADGALLTDLPLDADPELERVFEASPLDLVRLIAPTTTPSRARYIAGRSQGFVYYISRTGVTGARNELSKGLADQIGELQRSSTTPVAVGFGISTAEQAAAVSAIADGIIVGSALVDALAENGVEGGAGLVADLRRSTGRSAAVR